MNQWYSCSQKFDNPDEKSKWRSDRMEKERENRKRRRDHPIHAIR
jgi:hypothetical protein